MELDPVQLTTQQKQALLQGVIAPRPIALASTIDKDGQVNLSPFSFFNMFGTNPPILIFSPSRRVRDNTTKHTYENILEVPEVVIHVVTYSLVQQASLSSTEYEKGVNEFVKTGLTAAPAVKVKPPRVVESPAALECKVLQVIPTGTEGGSGNLIVCEVIYIHVNDTVLDQHGKIDPFKLDAVARLGGDWYCRVQGDAIFSVPKPLEKKGIGVDQLPESIRRSHILTGNDLGMLANVEKIPAALDHAVYQSNETWYKAKQQGEVAIHTLAHQYLEQGLINEAWQVLLIK